MESAMWGVEALVSVLLLAGGRVALAASRARLLARPSVARVVDEARPYRPFFPLGAPDRD